MTDLRRVAVIDIGKTNAKLALVDLASLVEIAVVTRPNKVLPGPPWPHFDVEGHWAFLLDALGRFHSDHGIDAISITTHGACVALLAGDGTLAAPILDYEHEGPEQTAAEYDAIRPPFAETGSPRLPAGLNIGAQLFWQFAQDRTLLERTAQIVTYPQYWGHRLTGVAASDMTSIGCHSDLWSPYTASYSTLPARLGIETRMAPMRKPAEILGKVSPHVSARTGLSPGTPVVVGIHDSNASLYPHVLTQKGPFSVVSTGTWVVAMTMGGSLRQLDPSRDTLVNVNALGQPVPSARFMGGREYEVILEGRHVPATDQDLTTTLDLGLMLLPAVAPSSGPFQGRGMQWTGDEPDPGTGLRTAVLSLYLAMMTDTCLRLTGASGPTIVEGPFAQNRHFLAMLAAATNRPLFRSTSATGTSIGASLLIGAGNAIEAPVSIGADGNMATLGTYATTWRTKAESS